MKRRLVGLFRGFMLLGVGLILWTKIAEANNLSLSNADLVNHQDGDQTWDIEFDLSWDNSWRIAGAPASNANWDAVWVFAKYSVYNAGTSTWGDWAHCKLVDGGSSAPGGSQIDLGDTGGVKVGAFIYRASAGTGSNDLDNARLRWDYGTDGVADDARVRVKVFGIEMVYISTGAFYVGDTDADNTNNFIEGGTTSAFQITSEGAITVANTAGNLYYDADNGNAGDRAGPIPAAFPKGYNAFYMMKYEITQQQYVDFLNALTGTQQAARASATTAGNFHRDNNTTNSPSNRGGIKCSIAPVGATPGVYVNDLNDDDVYNDTGDGQTLAANWLSWADGAAYADWAGLRPFTELEFEKAARGPLAAVDDEYAWGTAAIAGSAYTLSNSGAGNETIAANYSTIAGNASYTTTDGSLDGPLRAGIFAGHASNTGRVTSGGSYYGAMELSGNVWERAVTVGNATGRSFTGSHGDGTLNAGGNFTNGDWPGTNAVGSGFRGGSWGNGASDSRVADRNNAASTITGRVFNNGFRAARTFP